MERLGKNPVFWIVAALSAVYGLWYAWQIRWTCDDVFITLRYVDHWFAGKGIVYNTGEYVEGYTHFLWLLLLAAAGKLGFDMMNASMWLGWLSFAGVLFLSAWRARKLGLFVPLGMLYLTVHHDFAVWATGGLETMFYALLFYAVFYLRFESNLRYRNRLLWTGVLAGLAILTRPDASLLLAWLFLQEAVVLLWTGTSFRDFVYRLFQLGIGPLLLVGPWLLWKYNYYGNLLPNTYYAKSGGLSYFPQGWDYLDSYARAYVSIYLMLGLGLVGIVAPLFRKRKRGSRSPENVPLPGRSLSVFLFVALYVTMFVAKSGGDYMYARFIVPLLPLCTLLPENTWAYLFPDREPRRAVSALFLLLSVGWAGFAFVEKGYRDSLFAATEAYKAGGKWKEKIYDSHDHHRVRYPSEKYRRYGEELRPIFQGTNARVLNFGDCCLCYYAGFDFVLENFGLTDTYIAHKPLLKRESMVGHEKYAEREYMDKRSIQFCFNGPDFSQTPFTKFTFILAPGDTLKGDMLRYDYPLMEKIAGRSQGRFRFTDAYREFENLTANRRKLGTDSVCKAYDRYWTYYFRTNDAVPEIRRQEDTLRVFLGMPPFADIKKLPTP